MTTRKSVKTKDSKPRIDVSDLEPNPQGQSAESGEKASPKGGAEVSRHYLENAWPAKWKG